MHPQPQKPVKTNPCADLGWYQTLCKGFDHLGLDGVALCEEAGIHSAVAKKLPAPVLSDALGRAFEIAQETTGDPRVGLRMARHPLGSLGPLSHMLMACNNTQESLQFVSRYLPLFWPMATMDIQSMPDRSLIVMNVVQGRRSIPTALYDFFVCMVLAGYRIITGKRSKVLRLHHPGPMPEDPSKLTLKRGYKNTITYGLGLQFQATDSLTLRLGYEQRPTSVPNSAMDLIAPLPDLAIKSVGLGYVTRKGLRIDVTASYAEGSFSVPADGSCNLNCSNFLNAIYNPYGGLDVSGGIKIRYFGVQFTQIF